MIANIMRGPLTMFTHTPAMHDYQRASRPPVPAFWHSIAMHPRRRVAVMAASKNSRESVSSFDEESRLEALEKGVRKKQGARSINLAQRKAEKVSQAQNVQSTGMAEWNEGQWFPEGWAEMNPFQKVAELYTGKRGLLFWMGKFTYALIFVVIGGWIVFRFVLPGLGVLELQNGLDSPPNYGSLNQ